MIFAMNLDLANSDVFPAKTDNGYKCVFMCAKNFFRLCDVLVLIVESPMESSCSDLFLLAFLIFFCNSDYTRMAQGIVSMK